jgi:hypothetical protein
LLVFNRIWSYNPPQLELRFFELACNAPAAGQRSRHRVISEEKEDIMPKPPASNTARYPATLYPPPDAPNLGDTEDQRRLSPAAFRTFLNIMRHWKVRDEDARILLGGVSNGSFYKWKQDGIDLLREDTLRRISYLIGIFKSLNILFSEPLADRWVLLPNTNEIFAGRTPLAYMLLGGAPAMATVRQLLDARRGG